jgi:hypothetical protein
MLEVNGMGRSKMDSDPGLHRDSSSSAIVSIGDLNPKMAELMRDPVAYGQRIDARAQAAGERRRVEVMAEIAISADEAWRVYRQERLETVRRTLGRLAFPWRHAERASK